LKVKPECEENNVEKQGNFLFLPSRKRMTVRRKILNRIVLFRIFFASCDRCERTIEKPIIHTNQGKGRSARVNPFQTEEKYSRLQSIAQRKVS
jgi:hypothetical protein